MSKAAPKAKVVAATAAPVKAVEVKAPKTVSKENPMREI